MRYQQALISNKQRHFIVCDQPNNTPPIIDVLVCCFPKRASGLLGHRPCQIGVGVQHEQ